MKTIASLAILAILVITPVSARAQAELRGTPGELANHLTSLPQIVSIPGRGEITVAADKAEITLKVTTENKALFDSLRANQEIRARVAAYLKENGLGSNQIQGAKFSSTQRYGIFSEKAKSHRVDNFLKVTVRDEKEFQAVAAAVDRWDEVQFLGIDVLHSDKETLRSRARVLALDKATERRKLYEEKLGVKLVPKRFNESVVDPDATDRRESYYGPGYGSSAGVGLSKSASPGRGAAEPIEGVGSPFGELTYTARIVVEYAVEQPR